LPAFFETKIVRDKFLACLATGCVAPLVNRRALAIDLGVRTD
jgi:hypothetical protein